MRRMFNIKAVDFSRRRQGKSAVVATDWMECWDPDSTAVNETYQSMLDP